MGATFESLPTELRHCIWNLVLGSEGDPPTMVPFRTARPHMLEEDDEDEDMIIDMDESGEVISDEQFEEIRQLALHHIAGLNGTQGPVNPAPTTLPSNGVAQPVNDDDTGASATANGQAVTGPSDEAANDVTEENENENENEGDEEGAEEEDEEEDEDEEDDDEPEDDEFEPGNPYTQERAWDDEIVIPVYIAPLLLVNREARLITFNWMQKHDIQLIRHTIAKGELQDGFRKKSLPPLARKYDPERDHLYVDRHYWRRFCDRLQMPHMMAPNPNGEEPEPVHDIGETIKNLALPAFTVYQSVGMVGHILEYMPNLKQVSCIWSHLPEKRWQPKLMYDTVKRSGKPMTQVTNILLPRWDQERISETLSQEELDRRTADTERIKAERREERQEKQERKAQRAQEGGNKEGDEEEAEEEDESDEEDEDEDDDDEVEEGNGPIVTMCVRDPSDEKKVFYERGYLGDWLTEIYDELTLCELPDHVVDENDGSFTLPIVPCKIVKQPIEN